MQCFNGAHTFQAFPSHLKRMKEKVSGLSAQEMDNTDREAWIDYYCAEFQIDPIVMYPESKTVDIEEKVVQEYNAWSQVSRMEPKYFDRPGYRVTCIVPFSGDPGLFELQPNPHTLDSFEVDRIEKPGNDGIGHLVLSHELMQRDASAEGIEAHFEQRINAIRSEVEKVNIEARRFNEGIRDAVENAVDERIRQIDKLADIRRGLNIPLNRVKGAPYAKPMSLKKRKLSFSRPTPNATHEAAHSISDADYEAINSIIGDCGSLMEQAPESFASLDEEQLRDYLRGKLPACVRGGYDLRAARPVDAIAHARVPVLLLHGEGDRVVPVEMAHELAGAGTGHELHTFPGAGHCCAVFSDPGRYWDVVLGFVGRWA